MSAIGLDIGHSAVKVSVSSPKGEVHHFLVPTAVCRAVKISDEAEAERSAKATVTINGIDYFIGETAIIQGGANVTTGLSEDWINTPEHTALMLGAFKKAQKLSGVEQPKVVLGLPTHLYARQKEKLLEVAASILRINSSNIRVVAQPSGPYLEAMLDEKGAPASAVNEEAWGVVEIGYFTTDFMLMKNGRWVEKASGGCSGARVAAEHLQRILSKKDMTVDLLECEEALRKKFIRNFREKIDVAAEVAEAVSVLANEVIDTATRLMEPYARQLDGVIVAGGGAEFMFETIKRRWPHAVCPQNPRMSVSEGMRRYAAMLNIKDTLKED